MGCLKLSHTEENTLLKVSHRSDGVGLKGSAGPNRYGYQGQYAEEDTVTGFSSFELRMYDPIIGRWLSPDPYRQYPSPYLAMGNRPVSVTDPDGGCADDDYACWEEAYWDSRIDASSIIMAPEGMESLTVVGTDKSDRLWSKLLNAMDRFEKFDGVENTGKFFGDPGYVREGVPSEAFDFTEILITFGKDPSTYPKGNIPIPINVWTIVKDLLKESKSVNDAVGKLKLDKTFMDWLNSIKPVEPPRKNDVQFFIEKNHTLRYHGGWEIQVDSFFQDTTTTITLPYDQVIQN